MNDERGAATVFALALATVLMMVGLAVAWAGAAVARHRVAQSAADLAALAGAQAVQDGGAEGGTKGGAPCAVAAEVAAANRARLSACSLRGDDVWVSVELDAPPLLGRSGTLTGQARAGPTR